MSRSFDARETCLTARVNLQARGSARSLIENILCGLWVISCFPSVRSENTNANDVTYSCQISGTKTDSLQSTVCEETVIMRQLEAFGS